MTSDVAASGECVVEGSRLNSVDDRAANAQSYLVRAREAAAAAKAAQNASEAAAMVNIARAWLDLADKAMSDVLAAELRAAAAKKLHHTLLKALGELGIDLVLIPLLAEGSREVV
jgi:hypothetical protein